MHTWQSFTPLPYGRGYYHTQQGVHSRNLLRKHLGTVRFNMGDMIHPLAQL